MGLGQAVATLFSDEGASVVVADVSRPAGEETVEQIRARGGKAVFARTDVTRSAEVENMVGAAVESFGRLDILINNVGVQVDKDVVDTSEEEWDFRAGYESQEHVLLLEVRHSPDAPAGQRQHRLYFVSVGIGR